MFSEYDSPLYSGEGTEEFKKSMQDENYLAGIEYYGAFDGKTLAGVVGIRGEKKSTKKSVRIVKPSLFCAREKTVSFYYISGAI